MDTSKSPPESRQEVCTASGQNCFDLAYAPAEDVNPLELLGNAYLALHHHMAPADGGFDLGQADE